MRLLFFSTLLILISCSESDIETYVGKSQINENYRTTVTRKTYNENDSLIESRIYFKAFNKKNQLINNNDLSFYFYNSNHKIDSTVSFFFREGSHILMFRTKYIYNESGKLIKKLDLSSNITQEEYTYDTLDRIVKIVSNNTTDFEYSNNELLKKRIHGYGGNRESKYLNNSDGLPLVENWFFGENHRMKTVYDYKQGKLKSETIYNLEFDQQRSPNSQTATRTEYTYLENDSIAEIVKSYQVKKAKQFIMSERIEFEYLTK